MADLPQPNPGLTSSAAHNAVAALVEMYMGVMVDYERTISLYKTRVARLELEIQELRNPKDKPRPEEESGQ
jgi:hypothetical protein